MILCSVTINSCSFMVTCANVVLICADLTWTPGKRGEDNMFYSLLYVRSSYLWCSDLAVQDVTIASIYCAFQFQQRDAIWYVECDVKPIPTYSPPRLSWRLFKYQHRNPANGHTRKQESQNIRCHRTATKARWSSRVLHDQGFIMQ